MKSVTKDLKRTTHYSQCSWELGWHLQPQNFAKSV